MKAATVSCVGNCGKEIGAIAGALARGSGRLPTDPVGMGNRGPGFSAE